MPLKLSTVTSNDETIPNALHSMLSSANMQSNQTDANAVFTNKTNLAVVNTNVNAKTGWFFGRGSHHPSASSAMRENSQGANLTVHSVAGERPYGQSIDVVYENALESLINRENKGSGLLRYH